MINNLGSQRARSSRWEVERSRYCCGVSESSDSSLRRVILCQECMSTPRRFQMGAADSGWSLYDESVALQMSCRATPHKQ